MNDVMNICGTDVVIKEWHGKRVVTFKDIDTVHQRPEGTARKRFNDNRKHFVSGVDFFKVKGSGVRPFFGQTLPNGFNPNGDVTLIAESGYLMLVKSFTDDLAWKVQRELVDIYFRVKEQIEPVKQDIQVSVMQPEIFLEAARIMASVPDSQRYVINCLRHIVPDIDELPTVTVQTENAVIEVPVLENAVTQASIEGGKSYSRPFNHIQFNNYLIENKIKYYWLQAELGCSSGLISKWAYGKSKPTELYRIKLCQVLNLPVGYFDNSKRVRRVQRYE
ncbi:ORF6N domain-containing protein [Acetatifactor aquisgranensis]|uniref:ORF6N domain-containing protein n=1 Tax=Acetatifactor aquisgranensis TaxID=2941233 RepID=UPI00203A41C8|nr:ORF6N domain-containing protein [Acetatifactor aquisgranensis]